MQSTQIPTHGWSRKRRRNKLGNPATPSTPEKRGAIGKAQSLSPQSSTTFPEKVQSKTARTVIDTLIDDPWFNTGLQLFDIQSSRHCSGARQWLRALCMLLCYRLLAYDEAADCDAVTGSMPVLLVGTLLTQVWSENIHCNV
jgi:hypothetical protein